VSATGTTKLAWYARRLGSMSPAEIASRARDQAVRRAWSRRQVHAAEVASLAPLPACERGFASPLPRHIASLVPAQARAALIADAERLLAGEWEVLGVARTDMAKPDWFYDPVTGRRSQPDKYAFGINHRDEMRVGNIKQVWEISRLQHLTLLAAAWCVTREEAYAERVADQLRSWWRENPFLSGVNWTSGIELGIRLINFVWIRRLLADWAPVTGLYELDDLAVRQIRWHQEYLAVFQSQGSSANNHVIAEAAGLLAASCAFPWFPESDHWRRFSARLLERELARNTFPSGVNRELASDYHGFVAELGLFAAIEAEAAGMPLGTDTWTLLCSMVDTMAALVDERAQPPRQGDSDEGRVVLLDAPRHNRWPMLISLGGAAFGRLDWWPDTAPDVTSVLAGALAGTRPQVGGRPQRRPSHFADAGLTILRTEPADSPEIWCRCDGGPHGFLSIAAHAHADALSIEVRHGGVEVLADPGTYCYHDDLRWRSYFRSTIGHNTVELGGRSQSMEAGPFMWHRHARTQQIESSDATWIAEHDGYATLRPPARHRRSVSLDRAAGHVEITDVIIGEAQDTRLAFHLGPDVHAELAESTAVLSWPTPSTPRATARATARARLELPAQMRWSLHRGETDPILGWYSSGLGRRAPAFTILGHGQAVAGKPLTTRLVFQAEAE